MDIGLCIIFKLECVFSSFDGAYDVGYLGVACVPGRFDSEELIGLHCVFLSIDPLALSMVVEDCRLGVPVCTIASIQVVN